MDTAIPAAAAGAASLDAVHDRLLAGAEQDAASRQKAKIEKAGEDFESILLSSWLQKAEQSFGTVPGGDEDGEDSDPGAEQYQGIAMQALGGALARDGGIGVAKMIVGHLEAAADAKPAGESGTEKSGNRAKSAGSG